MSSSEDYDPDRQEESQSSSGVDQSAEGDDDLRVLHDLTEIADPEDENKERPEVISTDLDDQPSIRDSANLGLPPNPYAMEPSYYTRPNRYYGPVSTWRSWTQEERAIADSIEAEKAKDLSAHLYNAYALSARAGAHHGKGPAGKAKRKEGSEDPTYDSDKGAFKPAARWTAWPLPSEDVPRESLMPAIGQSSLRGFIDPRPSATLEDCIIAATVREARQRWKARRWVWKANVKRESALGESLSSSAEELGDGDEEPSQAESPISGGPENVQMFASQPYDESNRTSDSTEASEEDDNVYKADDDARPVPLADDEKSRQLLLPSTRHVLSKVDDLLLGLHKARYAYAVKPDQDAQGEAFPIDTTDTEQSRRSSQPRGRPRKRKALSPVPTGDSDTSSHLSMSSNKRKRERRQLGLRDWSDVLGMASLTGWNPEVVERASERCAALFGQNMLFRTFYEGKGTATGSFFTEQLANGEEPEYRSEYEEPTAGSEAESHTDDQARRSKQASREIDTSGSRGSRAPARPKTCPYRWCARFTQPFKDVYGMERHVRNIHANDPPPLLSEGLEDSDMGFQYPSAEQRIFCPVEGCNRHIAAHPPHPFSKGAKMYAHVKQMHRALNLDEVKKWNKEQRGERRGGNRWTGQPAPQTTSKRSGQPEACNGCLATKKRCDCELPQCGSCAETGVDCVYQREPREAEHVEQQEDEDADSDEDIAQSDVDRHEADEEEQE